MGLRILHNGQVVDFSGSKYEPNGYGTKRLNIRTGAGIKQYGLATSASYTSDKRVKFNIDGVEHYIGTQSVFSRASNYTSSSTYYTYTYTNTYPRSSVETRRGTETTATRTQPARYTYRASYYTGAQVGCTVQTSSHYYTRSAALSATVSVQYTAYWSGTSFITRGGRYHLVSVTRQVSNASEMFNNGSTRYTTTSAIANAFINTTVTSSAAYNGGWVSSYSGTDTGTHNVRVRTNTTRTYVATYNATKSYQSEVHIEVGTPVTSSRAHTVYVQPPNNYGVGAWAGPYGRLSGTVGVAASNYRSSSEENSSTDGHAARLSFRSISYQYYYNLYSSSSQPDGSATLTSTNTPIGGVPSNYTLSAGPSVINSQASYTYTDAGCTRTYAYNYSTHRWTETQTLTSNSPIYSSVGTTATTRASYYTEHNFI